MTDTPIPPSRPAIKNTLALRAVIVGGFAILLAAALPIWTIEAFIWIAKI